ncbi:MAG: putative bifunctional diguanylate cyclase/phosphodiesterase [Solirubrobacteraceae bacterium]
MSARVKTEPEALSLVLVEDSPGDAVLAREMLAETWGDGLAVIHLQRADDARRHLLEHEVGCVLLDLSLPDAGGLQALDQVRSSAPGVPIVVLSGLDDEELALRAVQEGAQDYLIKGQVTAEGMSRSIRYAVERKRAEAAMAHKALHDPLTGLANRPLFLDRLALALARSRRSSESVAVLFLDLDHFKEINDSLGHEAGDQLLVHVARRVEGALRPADSVARFGGDEFTILCDAVEDERDAAVIAERVLAALARPFPLGEEEVSLGGSLGLSLGGQGSTPEGLVRNADIAMYRAKERGGSCYEIFDELMRTRAAARLDAERALRRALERRELRLHWQPSVDLRTGAVAGLECLLRWEHPERGLLGPEEFLALAEETWEIVPIGHWVLQEACRQARRWIDLPQAPTMTVAVNLSARQLTRPELPARIVAALRASDLDHSALRLDVSEEALTADLEGGLAALEGLRRSGLRVTLDDFGTGHARLGDLKRLPVDALKLDPSYVAGLGSDAQDGAIAGAVIGLAHALGLQAMAEGVETREQLDALKALGCDLVQGYYFSRPLSASAMGERLWVPVK